jgi:hypothetical protein
MHNNNSSTVTDNSDEKDKHHVLQSITTTSSITASTNDAFCFTFDSAADVHLLTLEAAMKLFNDSSASSLKIVGVNGSSCADLEGQLIVVVRGPSGRLHSIDMGRAYALASSNYNLISVAQLLKDGAVVHFEKDNSYLQPHPESEKIPFTQRNGLFELVGQNGTSLPSSSTLSNVVLPQQQKFSACQNPLCSATVNAISTTLKDWHRRMVHLDPSKIAAIVKTGRVDGLKVKGSIVVDQHYQCPSCRLAKAKKGKTPHSTEFPQPVNYVGHVISTDVKSVPFISYRGYKYAVVFVDHYCRKGWVYFMRKLDEVSSKLIIFLDDLKKLDVKVKKNTT